MKCRPPLMMIVLLLLGWGAAGAIVNIAVAWAFGLLSPSPWNATRFGDVPNHQGAFWRFVENRTTGLTSVWWMPEHERLIPKKFLLPERLVSPPWWVTMEWQNPPDSTMFDAKFAAIIENACGWPCRSMLRRTDIWIGTRNGRPAITSDSKWVLTTSNWTLTPVAAGAASAVQLNETHRGLALRPIWPGFAINTVFYAGVLWLLFAAPFALRRRRRIKRGLCPKCAYDLRGRGSASQTCPECGAAVPLSLERERAGVREGAP